MDCDGQDPIGEVLNICAQFDLGQDIIFMQRLSREDKLIKKMFAKSYYFLLTNILGSKTHVDVGDFYGLSSRAKKSLLNYPERIKYIRGMLTLIGYNFVILKYHRDGRKLGQTKYSPSKMFKLAIDGITGFSVKPLLFASVISLFGLLAGSFLIIYIIYLKLKLPEALMPGWAFSTILFTFFNMLIMLVLGFISLYLSRVMIEIKNRPIYHLKDSSDD
jgi:dolichol-phosphate mannosyltransferase